jgi:hypothetical protein
VTAKTDWYSIRAEFKPIASELRSHRGEWYLQVTLLHEFRDTSGVMQTEKMLLGSIDFDHIDLVELRRVFYETTEKALDALHLPPATRNELAAQLRLVVRPPDEDTIRQPRIGLGAVLPDEK